MKNRESVQTRGGCRQVIREDLSDEDAALFRYPGGTGRPLGSAELLERLEKQSSYVLKQQ